MATKKTARLAPPKDGYWRAKGKKGTTRLIAFGDLSDDHLQRAYFITQNKMLEFNNKMIKFAELNEKLEEEAIKRDINLNSIENEPNHKIGTYFENERKLKP